MARNYRREYDKYQGKPEQIKNRAKRNAARTEMVKEGRASKGDGKDVDHRMPLSKGGSTSKKNLRVVSVHTNRAYKRRSDRKPA
jgi:hypothetical protein